MNPASTIIFIKQYQHNDTQNVCIPMVFSESGFPPHIKKNKNVH